MRVTKANLEFLEVFTHLIDSSSERGEHFRLHVREDVAYFSQFGEDYQVTSRLKLSAPEKLSTVFPTERFRKLISEAKPTDQLEITETAIKFSSEEVYHIEPSKMVIQDALYLDRKLEHAPSATIQLSDLKLLSKAKTYTGGDEGFNVVAYQNGYFVSTDEHTTCIVKTSNSVEREFFLDKKILALLEKSKLPTIQIDFYDDQAFYTFVVKGVRVFVMYRSDVLVPFLVDEESRALYNFPHTAKVPRELFLEKLRRVGVTAETNIDRRIHLLFSKQGVSIENRDHNKTAVLVPGVTQKEIVAREVVVSANSLAGIVQKLEGQELIFKTTPPNTPAAVLTLTDEQQKMFVLHTEYRVI